MTPFVAGVLGAQAPKVMLDEALGTMTTELVRQAGLAEVAPMFTVVGMDCHDGELLVTVAFTPGAAGVEERVIACLLAAPCVAKAHATGNEVVLVLA